MSSSKSKDTSHSRRRWQRFTKRLETKFSSGDSSSTGISSNLSEGGLFIRTQRGYIPGTPLDIDLIMSDGKISHLKGIVKNVFKTPLSSLKNGMGVEIIEKDETYIQFLKSFGEEPDTET